MDEILYFAFRLCFAEKWHKLSFTIPTHFHVKNADQTNACSQRFKIKMMGFGFEIFHS